MVTYKNELPEEEKLICKQCGNKSVIMVKQHRVDIVDLNIFIICEVCNTTWHTFAKDWNKAKEAYERIPNGY